MGKRKRYTDEFRASAVIMLEAQGYPDVKGALTLVAEHLNIQPRTLSRWFNKESNPPPDKIVKEKKGEFIDKLDRLLDKFVDEMFSAADDAPLNHLAVAYGVVTDKKQLLTGQPTERTESHVSGDLDIRTDIQRKLARIAAAEDAESVPGEFIH